jgi:hypothetical protein
MGSIGGGEGGTKPLTEICTRSREKKFLGSTMRPAHKADNLTAMCEPIV